MLNVLLNLGFFAFSEIKYSCMWWTFDDACSILRANSILECLLLPWGKLLIYFLPKNCSLGLFKVRFQTVTIHFLHYITFPFPLMLECSIFLPFCFFMLHLQLLLQLFWYFVFPLYVFIYHTYCLVSHTFLIIQVFFLVASGFIICVFFNIFPKDFDPFLIHVLLSTYR